MAIVNRYDYLLKYICSEVKEVRRFTVLYRDVFSMKLVYFLLFEWLQEHGYGHQQPWEIRKPGNIKQKDTNRGLSDKDFPEIQYVHKETPIGTEIWLRWRCQKIEPRFPYWAKQLDIDIHVLGLNPAEVIVDGKKVKADKGEVEIVVNSFLLIDLNHHVKNHNLFKHFYKLFYYNIYGSKTDTLENELKDEAWEFRTAIKEYFKLPTYKDIRELSRFYARRDEA